jgi:hypothetical protein
MPHLSAPKIDVLLADPLIQAMMQADRVEAGALKGLLTSVATRVAAGRDARVFHAAPARFASAPRPASLAYSLPPPSFFAACYARLCG